MGTGNEPDKEKLSKLIKHIICKWNARHWNPNLKIKNHFPEDEENRMKNNSENF